MVAIMQKIGIASEDGLQSTFTAGASTFVIAYACHKVFMPVRIFLTITCTPVIVGKLRSLGILKDKTVKEKAWTNLRTFDDFLSWCIVGQSLIGTEF